MTDITADLEEWATMGALGTDVQVYDLTAVTAFIAEIADANREAEAPLFSGGLPPAQKCLLLISGYHEGSEPIPVYIERTGETSVKCVLMKSLVHNHVLGYMIETTHRLADRIAAGGLPPPKVQVAIDWLDKNDWLDPSKVENQMHEVPVYQIGSVAPDPSVDNGKGAVAGMASAACSFMAMPIAKREPGALPRAARRRLERSGKQVKIVNVTVSRSVTAGLARGHGEGVHGRALHFVSGHWRISPTSIHAQMVHGQMKIWIEGFWRGDPEHGVVLHRYLARKRAA